MFSCKENRQKIIIQDTVTEWIGKEILFPNNYQCNFMGRDSVANPCIDLMNTEYKVLIYIDSLGCMSCKLRLFEWRVLMQEMDRISDNTLSFLFFFNPKNENELKYFLLRDRMDYPVFIDKQNEINKLNTDFHV
jgi:hypothetical protein